MAILRFPIKPVSFCTCDDGRALCPSCRSKAGAKRLRKGPPRRKVKTENGLLVRCPDCNKFCESYEGVDGVTEWYCPDCTRFEPAVA